MKGKGKPKPSWLKKVEHDKRKVKDEPIFLDDRLLKELEVMIQKVMWPYKNNTELLQLRDKAMVAFFILTGIRNSEKNQLTRKMFRVYEDRILVVNIQPLKHGILRDEIILPKIGGLAPFTLIFEEWLNQIPLVDESDKPINCVIFPTATPSGSFAWNQPLGRQRFHWIIKSTTGLFAHWLRGVCESVYGKIIFKNDAWALKDFMGLVNLDSTSPYVSGQWKTYEKEVLKVSINAKRD